MKVEQWKTGTSPNSGENEVIPAEANQNSPLGRQKRVLLGQKLWRLLAAAKEGGEPWAQGHEPWEAPPWLEKETGGAVQRGPAQKPRGEGGLSELSAGGDAAVLEKPLDPGHRRPTELSIPGLCSFVCLFFL